MSKPLPITELKDFDPAKLTLTVKDSDEYLNYDGKMLTLKIGQLPDAPVPIYEIKRFNDRTKKFEVLENNAAEHYVKELLEVPESKRKDYFAAKAGVSLHVDGAAQDVLVKLHDRVCELYAQLKKFKFDGAQPGTDMYNMMVRSKVTRSVIKDVNPGGNAYANVDVRLTLAQREDGQDADLQALYAGELSAPECFVAPRLAFYRKGSAAPVADIFKYLVETPSAGEHIVSFRIAKMGDQRYLKGVLEASCVTDREKGSGGAAGGTYDFAAAFGGFGTGAVEPPKKKLKK